MRELDSRVLMECSEVLANQNHHLAHRSEDRALSHPDIQFFQRIKHTNHWHYHKRPGRSIDKIKTSATVSFDPFSVGDLLSRLKTFSALNWRVPTSVIKVNELICAQNGWKCISFSKNNSIKNHLVCTCCLEQMALKWDDSPSRFQSVFWGQNEDDTNEELDKILEARYLEKIQSSGHSPNCSWRQFETPLVGFYYPRPYICDDSLIFDYVENLENLVANSGLLLSHHANFDSNFMVAKLKDGFIENSNKMLAQRGSISNDLPSWVYRLAILGWSLHVQSFSNKLVLLLICNKCNSRIFLNSAPHPAIPAESSVIGLNLNPSKVLSPCSTPMTTPGEDIFDPYCEHKPWCCNINNVASATELVKYYDFFEEMMVQTPMPNKKRASELDRTLKKRRII